MDSDAIVLRCKEFKRLLAEERECVGRLWIAILFLSHEDQYVLCAHMNENQNAES